DADEARVEASDGAALVAHQFFVEAIDVDAEVRLFEILRRESAEARELRDHRLLFGVGEIVAFHQCRRVFAEGELFGLRGDYGDGERLQNGGKALVIPRRRAVRRQEDDVRKIVAGVESRGAEVEDRRDQHDSVEIEALIVQPAGEAGRARRAVALACEKLRRAPARIARGDEADYAAHRLDVRFEAVELLRVVERNGAAESRRHGLAEHEIAYLAHP